MQKDLQRRVHRRARHACEYCLMPQSAYRFTFPIDHIIAKQHGGKTTFNNLAEACLHCNSRKGTNLAGIDPETGRLTRLFHPRRDRWPDHFRLNEAEIVAITSIGRATIVVLDMNHPDSIAVRQSLIAEEAFPPEGAI